MKRVRLIAILVVTLLQGCHMFRPTGSKEPSYQGRRLSEWLNDYAETFSNPEKFRNSETTRDSAEHAVKEIGTNAIPTLLKWLQVKDSPLKTRSNLQPDKQHYVHFRSSTFEDTTALAQYGFTILGNDALSAVPALVQIMQSPEPNRRIWALDSLINITQEKDLVLPVLLQSLRDSDKRVQTWSAMYLWNNYPDEAEKAGVYKMFPELKP